MHPKELEKLWRTAFINLELKLGRPSQKADVVSEPNFPKSVRYKMLQYSGTLTTNWREIFQVPKPRRIECMSDRMIEIDSAVGRTEHVGST